jgi:signal transduction histidine kinase
MAIMLQAGQAVIDSGEMRYIAPDVSRKLREPGALLPLQIRDRKLGVLAIIGAPESSFTPDQLALFKSIADQLSVAIENAHLFEKAEDVAVAAERNRLARELHDAVTQTLFSASLIADVLPRIWERDPDQGRVRLEELRELTRGALAEMRTLLLELRPATLTEASLAELLRQLTQAFGGRSRLPIELIVEGERPLPPETQVALYRITQEALNNITKHAGANQAILKLQFSPQAVSLSIHDNGRGFDLADVPPNSLGLSIMRERAEKIGAKLAINSRIGEGTIVTIHTPIAFDNEEDHERR